MKKFFIPFCVLLFVSCETPGKKEALQKFHSMTFPAVKRIGEIQNAWALAELNATLWTEMPGASAGKDKLKLFVNEQYHEMRVDLKQMVTTGVLSSKNDVDSVCDAMDKEILAYKNLMGGLSTADSYNNPATMFPMRSMVTDNDGECVALYKMISERLADIGKKINDLAEKQLQEAQ